MRLRLSNSLLMGFAFLIAGGMAVHADTLNGGIVTTWSGPGAGSTLGTMAAPTDKTTPGTPYWNGLSGDDAGFANPGSANIGWNLAGGGNVTLPGGTIGNIPYYSSTGTNAAGNAPTNMYFTGNAGNSTNSTLIISLTSQHGVGGNGLDSLYYYLTNGLNGTPIGAPILLFTGAGAPGISAAMTIPAGDGYGFALQNTGNGPTDTYYMDDLVNTPADGKQHFAVFQQSTTSYYIGAEDGVGLGDADFNDMVIHLTTTPEPASMGLLGGSLLLMGALMRRRSRKDAGK